MIVMMMMKRHVSVTYAAGRRRGREAGATTAIATATVTATATATALGFLMRPVVGHFFRKVYVSFP